MTVIVHNQTTASKAELRSVRAEVSAIFLETGIEVVWADPDEDSRYSTINPISNALGTFTSQIIIRPRSAPASPSGSTSVLGTTLGEGHETGGSAFVFYDRVLKVAHEQRKDVATILGYAMAHEIGHLLLPYPAHSEAGIMRPAWDGDDLRHAAGGSLRFTASQIASIRMKTSACGAGLTLGSTR